MSLKTVGGNVIETCRQGEQVGFSPYKKKEVRIKVFPGKFSEKKCNRAHANMGALISWLGKYKENALADHQGEGVGAYKPTFLYIPPSGGGYCSILLYLPFGR